MIENEEVKEKTEVTLGNIYVLDTLNTSIRKSASRLRPGDLCHVWWVELSFATAEERIN